MVLEKGIIAKTPVELIYIFDKDEIAGTAKRRFPSNASIPEKS
jgi:hypothetical protein